MRYSNKKESSITKNAILSCCINFLLFERHTFKILRSLRISWFRPYLGYIGLVRLSNQVLLVVLKMLH